MGTLTHSVEKVNDNGNFARKLDWKPQHSMLLFWKCLLNIECKTRSPLFDVRVIFFFRGASTRGSRMFTYWFGR